jgi:hypothetical protein
MEAQPPVVLQGNGVMVKAETKNGCLQERYLAFRDGAWIEVAATDPGRTLGPVSVVTAESTPLAGAVRSVSLSDGSLVEENRIWTADKAIDNAYYLLVTASTVPGQAYREAVRFHWERFGRVEQARAADQQAGTKAGISSYHWGTDSGMAGIEIEEDYLHDGGMPSLPATFRGHTRRWFLPACSAAPKRLTVLL